MDYRSDTPDWNHLRAFLATAEAGSLSAAARRLGLTQPTLSRQIAALESRMSLMLFERVGRGLVLTDAGHQLLPHAQAMGAAAERMALSATGQREEVSGRVRITVGDMMAATFLPRIIVDVQQRAPKVVIDVVATNDISDLMRREADIAIRHVRPEQPDLVARLVREATGRFYASTSYLDRRGRPKTFADLAHHDWISFGDVDRALEYMTAMGVEITRDAFRASSENSVVVWEMAKAGLGITPMDDVIGGRTAGMEAILGDDLTVDFPIWLVAHREVHTSPRIRLVFDILADALAVT